MSREVGPLFPNGIEAWLNKPYMSYYWLTALRWRPEAIVRGLPCRTTHEHLAVLTIMRDKYGYSMPKRQRTYLNEQVEALVKYCAI